MGEATRSRGRVGFPGMSKEVSRGDIKKVREVSLIGSAYLFARLALAVCRRAWRKARG